MLMMASFVVVGGLWSFN